VNAYLSPLDGPLDKAVLHALKSIFDDTALPGYTCDSCDQLYAERLPAIVVTMLMGGQQPAEAAAAFGKNPVGVVVHLCAPCRAGLESQSQGVPNDLEN